MEKIGTEQLLQWDREHVMHPMCRLGTNRGIVIASAEGIFLRDTEGREYIDASAQLANVNIGHGRREVIQAIVEQLDSLQYATTHWGMTHPSLVLCAKQLADITPAGLKHFFFGCGGADAVGAAFKIARSYWLKRKPDKLKIITLYNAFHGVSLGTLAATHAGEGRLQTGYGPLVPGFLAIPSYDCYRCSFGLEYPRCRIRCADFLAETIRNEGKESVAAFIAEPVQGQGMICPPPEYWPKVREICTENEVLLIDDEVMSGFGRTGKMFAVEHWGVIPDILTLAKGITSGYIPFGVTAIQDHIFEELRGRDGIFTHGLTYCGHPVGAAAALADIGIILRENLAENAARVGRHALNRLRDEFLSLPAVGDVSGLGLMIGIEYVVDKKTKAIPPGTVEITRKITDRALQKGIFLRVSGNRVTLAPPLIIREDQMDQILSVLKPILADIPGL
jgi:putrescine---pyruvate transaminase